MNNREQELKIALTKPQYNKLLKASGKYPLAQINMYFCCEGQPRDTMVRLRLKLGEYTFCYKKLLESCNGVNVCDEREQVVDNAVARDMIVCGISPSQFTALTGLQTDKIYRFVGELTTWRVKFELEHKWTLELDKNEYLGATDYELECECDNVLMLEELKSYLDVKYGIAFAPSASKSERFAQRFYSKCR